MVRYGIIGVGRMGKNHAGVIAAIEDAKITAVYDINPEASAAMKEKYPEVDICNSAEELAAREDVDCVIITSPTYCHNEGIAAAVKYQKAIFCEKALCRTPEQCDEIAALVAKHTKLFAVGFVRRHMSKSIVAKRMLESGKLGRIRYCNVELPTGRYSRQPGDWFADFNLCGGVIIDMLAHHIDLANWFFGEPDRIYADSMLLTTDQPQPADYVASVITYKSGVICNMMCSWARCGRSCELMEIHGDLGTLSISAEDNVTFQAVGGEPEVIDSDAEMANLAALDPGLTQVNFGGGFSRELTNLTAAVAGKNVELPGFQDAVNSLKVSFAMIDSTNQKQVIKIK